MPFKQFDRTQLKLKPLNERIHDLDMDIMVYPSELTLDSIHPSIDKITDRILRAKEEKASIILMMGAHVIRAGVAPLLIDLMKKELITHFALNGAGGIHDFELAMIGGTSESVAKYISEGQFGLWEETGRINYAAKLAVKEGIGFGEAIGKMIEEENFKYKDTSLLAAGYRYQVPITIHVGIGSDIIHEHPNCNGAYLGESSYTDFLIYANSISNLEKGVFLNFGSAVTGPEVYLKCLSMVRNVAHQKGEKVTNFTTAVFDLLPLEGEDIHETPPKADPRYYFRPWKTIMSRTVADGGESFYIQGHHRDTVSMLYKSLIEKLGC